MDDDANLGLNLTCPRCGGQNRRHADSLQQYGNWTRPALGSGPRQREVKVLYVCGGCGRRELLVERVEEEPPV